MVLTGSVRVVVDAQDPDGQVVKLRYQWFANKRPLQGETDATLEPDSLNRGDRVSVEVTPWDLKSAGDPYRTDEVEVVNTAPKVTEIRFEPFPPRVGDRLMAHVKAEDVDRDDITYRFRWSRNDNMLTEGEDRSLDLTGFQRGDRIRLEVIVEDAETTAEPQRSESIEIVNSPPEITSTPPSRIEGVKYEYTLTARDRDGDALVYRLESGPDDMKLDEKTGRILWVLKPDYEGTFPVRVTVSDGQGDPAIQEFDLVVGGRSKKDTQESQVPPDREDRPVGDVA